ncbi:MAG: carbohydrate ABC transporter permease [Bacillota bacterium]
MRENRIVKTVRMLLALLIAVICIIPFYVLLVLALNSPARIFYEGNMFIPSFDFGNFALAWEKSKIYTAILNSAIITGGTLSVSVVFGGMAGYAVARRPTRYNRAVFMLLIGCMMIPGIINTVPLYTLMRALGAINTLWGMAMICATLCMPSAVFIYTTFVRAIPKELDESAEVDGCGGLQTFWRIIFPILKPATASFVILNGFGVWNNYAQAVFFLQSRAKQNIPQALSVFFQQFGGAKWHLVSATAAIAIVPVVIIFLVFQRQFIRGLTEGAVKG